MDIAFIIGDLHIHICIHQLALAAGQAVDTAGWVYVMNAATETKNSPSGRSYICSPPSSVTISDSESMEADSAILPALSSATYSLMLPASLSALLEHPARIASSPI